ncbi:MAG: metal ABC transporter permease [Candidatus Moranbacteria bacterium]|nr:metal ABC transporter permease [Candidatus Moranbacteria bacterium]
MGFADFLGFAFIQRAYLAGSFIAVLCAMLGLFLVLRRFSLIGDGLSHVSFGGIALGLFLGLEPLWVALPISVAASSLILVLSRRARLYGDAAIAIVSSSGIALGVVLASLAGGFNVDLMSYLFGNILAVSPVETYLSVLLSAVVLAVIAFLYHDLFSVAFDEEYATVSGIRTGAVNILLATLTAVSVVLAVKVVGVMLVSALLVLPAVSALQVARGFRGALLLSSCIAVLSVLVGITVSFLADIPAGGTVVLVNLLVFFVLLAWKRIR